MDAKEAMALYGKLSEPMPQEALTTDSGRGFNLTSIKATYVIERLNEVFGLLGLNWRYAYSPFRVEGPKDEILTEVVFQWRASDGATDEYCPPFDWVQDKGWLPRRSAPAVWSEPIFATGGSGTNKKGSVPHTDATKGAVTNGLSKAASRLGVGLEIFKGESPDNRSDDRKAAASCSKPAPRPKPTTPTKRPGNLKSLEDAQAAAADAYGKLKEATSFNGAADKLLGSLYAAMQKAGIEMPAARLVQMLLGRDEAIAARHVMAVSNVLPKLSSEVVDILNTKAAESFDDHQP